MPWLETDVRDQRIQFVVAVRQPGATMAAVCRAFGISRKTGYKWLRREAAAGSVAALATGRAGRSTVPHRTAAVIECASAVAGAVRLGRREAGGRPGRGRHVLAPRTIDGLFSAKGGRASMRRRRRPCGRFERAGAQ